MFNATFNNISIISWRSILLVKKTTDLSQVADKRKLKGQPIMNNTKRHRQHWAHKTHDEDKQNKIKRWYKSK